MQPETPVPEHQSPSHPESEVHQAPPVAPVRKKMSNRHKLALWLMIAPTALYIAALLLFAVANLALGATLGNDPVICADQSSNGEAPARLFNDECDSTPTGAGAIISVMNILLFLVGAVSFLTWLPGLIIGIVLLTTKPRPPESPTTPTQPL